MIHPDTVIKKVSPEIGYGIFATQFIPKGTIVYVKDPMEIEFSPDKFKTLPTHFQNIVEKYSYIDETGTRILSWDAAKYVNHNCNCNTMSSGFGFEIAIKDIFPGEEITDEYGLFNLVEEMPLACNCRNCRKKITNNDIFIFGDIWDSYIIDSLNNFNSVVQPLLNYMDSQTHEDLICYINNSEAYISVKSLKNNYT